MFCPKCGNQLPDAPTSTPKNNKILIVCAFVICILVSFFGGRLVGKSSTPDKTEGKGYNTAEEAMQAFAEAFAKKDIDKMYSCCAVESYIANFDYEEYLEELDYFYPGYLTFIGNNPNSLSLLYDQRKGNLASAFYCMYMYASLPEGSPLFTDNFIDMDEYDADSIIEMLEDADSLDDIKVEEVKKASKYLPSSLGLTDISYASYEDIFNTDVENLAAKLDIGGDKFILFADVVKFDGKWYILALNQDICGKLDISYYTYGLIREEIIEDYDD